jgi:drug/metabolite transporter (DMT)-like permease
MKSFIKGDSILYLNFALFNALLYTVIKLFANKTGMKTLEIASYMNIGVFALYNVFFFKYIWKNKLYFKIFKPANLILSASMVAAVTKMYSIQHIEPRDAVVITHATPFLVMIFATFFLGEKTKLKHWLYGILAFVGACVYVSEKISINNIYYVILLFHMCFKAAMHVGTRNKSKSSVFEVMFYDNFFYSCFAVGYFGYNGGFDPSVFVSSFEIPLVIVITTISLFSLVKSYSMANSGISRLQNLDFSKIIFAFILGILLLGETVEKNEIIGVGIIFLSIFLSHVDFKKAKKAQISK